MKIDEALYQIKQNIKMHEIEGTTSNQNEREKVLLDYITNLQEENEKEHYLVDKLTRQLNDEYKNTEYQCKQKENYKSINEKAIEYLEIGLSNYEEQEELLNILKGVDKE